MSSDFDATDFVDSDYQAGHQAPQGGSGGVNRAPTREEVDSKVGETQQKLAELKRVQEQLERERSALEETRRRQLEFQNGKQEMVQNLTRGVGLLEEAEFNARRDAEQMGKTLADLKEALVKVEFLQEEAWNKENFSVELTRALTTIENARMEWNAARLKFDILSGKAMEASDEAEGDLGANSLFANRSFFELCKLGLALTWPLVVVASLAFAALLVILSQRH
jgi:hypothetical protein